MRTIDPAILFAAMATTLPSQKVRTPVRPRRVTFAPVKPAAVTTATP
jgi:hypothetical protein